MEWTGTSLYDSLELFEVPLSHAVVVVVVIVDLAPGTAHTAQLSTFISLMQSSTVR